MTDDADDLMVAADAREQAGDLAGAAALRLALPARSEAEAYAALAAALAGGGDANVLVTAALAGAARSRLREWEAFLAANAHLVARGGAEALAQLTGRPGALQRIAVIGEAPAVGPTVMVVEPARGSPIDQLIVNADGTRALVLAESGRLVDLDLATGASRVLPFSPFAIAADATFTFGAIATTQIVRVDLVAGTIASQVADEPRVKYLAISGDGRHVIAGFWRPDELSLWSLPDDRHRTIGIGGETTCAPVIVGDRAIVGIETEARTGLVEIFDLATTERVLAIALPGAPDAMCLRGDRLAVDVLSDEHRFEIRDLATGTLVRAVVHELGVRIDAIDFTTAGELIATVHEAAASRSAVALWNIADGARTATLAGHHAIVRRVHALAGGTRAVTGSEDGTVRVWDLTRARAAPQPAALAPMDTGVPAAPAAREIAALVATGDGGVIVSTAWTELACHEPTGALRWRMLGDRWRIACCGDGFAISVASRGVLERDDLRTGAIVAFAPLDDTPFALVVHPTSAIVVGYGGYRGRLRAWDALTLAQLDAVPAALEARHVAFTADGAHLVLITAAGSLEVWDVATWRRVHAIASGIADAADLVVAGDRAVACSREDDHGRCWNLTTGEPCWDLPIERAVALADGTGFACGTADCEVVIVDLDGAIRRTLAVDVQLGLDALAARGPYVAAIGRDHRVRVWDVATGHLVGRWQTHAATMLELLADDHLAIADLGVVSVLRVRPAGLGEYITG